MRAIPVNLTHRDLFSVVEIEHPATSALSRVLYAGDSCKKLSEKGYFVSSEKRYAKQWTQLIGQFSGILKKELTVNIHQIHAASGYGTVFNHLTKGIIDSVFSSGDGLLPMQSEKLFDELKRNLEDVCYFFLTAKNSEKKRHHRVLNDLCSNLAVCGFGLFHNIQTTRDMLYKKEGLEFWLAELRTLIVRQYADSIAAQINDDRYRIHIHNAFSQYAHDCEWTLLSYDELKDVHIRTAFRLYAESIEGRALFESNLNQSAIIHRHRENCYLRLHRIFNERYRSEAIGYVTEQLKNFVLEKFQKYATAGKIQADALSHFSKDVQKVMDSFRLSGNDFLTMEENAAGDMDYVIDDAKIDGLYMRVLHCFYLKGFVDPAALIELPVNKSITAFYDVHNRKKYFVVPFSEFGGGFFRYFETGRDMSFQQIENIVVDPEVPSPVLLEIVNQPTIALSQLFKVSMHCNCDNSIKIALVLNPVFRRESQRYAPLWTEYNPKKMLVSLMEGAVSVELARATVSHPACTVVVLKKAVGVFSELVDFNFVLSSRLCDESTRLEVVRKIAITFELPLTIVEKIESFFEFIHAHHNSEEISVCANALISSIRATVENRAICDTLFFAAQCVAQSEDPKYQKKARADRFFSHNTVVSSRSIGFSKPCHPRMAG